MRDNIKEYPVGKAICIIAVTVELMHARGTPYNAAQIVELIDAYCEVVPSPRWKSISEGVVKKLEYWEVIDNEGEIV